MENSSAIEEKLDTLIQINRHLLAVELARSGMSRADIAKHLHLAKATVVSMLQGIDKEK